MVIGIIGNPYKEEVPAAVRPLLGILAERDIPYLLHDESLQVFKELADYGEFVTMEQLKERCDTAIAFGGDGTMLWAGRHLAGSGIPLLGVNLGKLGFMAEVSVEELPAVIDELAAGKCPIVERTLLAATFPNNPDLGTLVGLNDIVIDKRSSGRLIELETHINGDYLGTYRADGLVLATPTGSTAYALAAGGPIITPNAGVLVIAPIAPHMLTARPVVVPDSAVIDIRPLPSRYDDGLHVYADGQVHRRLSERAGIRITRHPKTVCLVKRATTTYFDILRAKLLWGREPVLDHDRKQGASEE